MKSIKEDNRMKFKELVDFLKTVPTVEPSEEEKKLMSFVDNKKARVLLSSFLFI